ncbi:MAG TPA: hypothetical protein VKN18_07620 [Blastocatellia bacterium]|nr:hypothetical protein [Blastocatellia bacterium]
MPRKVWVMGGPVVDRFCWRLAYMANRLLAIGLGVALFGSSGGPVTPGVRRR